MRHNLKNIAIILITLHLAVTCSNNADSNSGGAGVSVRVSSILLCITTCYNMLYRAGLYIKYDMFLLS